MKTQITLTTRTHQSIRRGKIIGVSTGRFIVAIGNSTVHATGSGYAVGDSVLVTKVDNTFRIISKQVGTPNTAKEVFIDG